MVCSGVHDGVVVWCGVHDGVVVCSGVHDGVVVCSGVHGGVCTSIHVAQQNNTIHRPCHQQADLHTHLRGAYSRTSIGNDRLVV